MPSGYKKLTLEERREIKAECNKHEVPRVECLTERKCGPCPHSVIKRTDATKTQYFACKHDQRPHTWELPEKQKGEK